MNIAEEVLTYYQKIFENRLAAGTSGNVSFYDWEKGQVWITPSSLEFDKMTEADIVITGLDGEKINHVNYNPSSEWRLHTVLYKHYPEACAVVHTHSPYASAFSVANIPIPRILVEMDYFTDGEIPVSRFAPCGSEELAEHVAETMNGRSTCLMQNHGVVAVGKSLQEAYKRAAYVEDAAKIAYFAQRLDGKRLKDICMSGV